MYGSYGESMEELVFLLLVSSDLGLSDAQVGMSWGKDICHDGDVFRNDEEGVTISKV